MKNTLAITTATALALALSPMQASAVDAAAKDTVVSGEKHKHKHMRKSPPKSRVEAISRTKERLRKLESMTDAEWEEHAKEHHEKHKMRKERRDKIRNMSPEDRAELKKKFQELREE